MTKPSAADRRFDVIAFGAHPDDLEVVLGGTAAKLVRNGLSVLFVDLCDGEPARHAKVGERTSQAIKEWDQVARGTTLSETEPHEIDRLFFGHCRMEPAWDRFDFAVDVSDVYETKMSAIRAFESVFSGDQASLIDKYNAEDRYIGSLTGVRYAEAFRARSPLLVNSPEVFSKIRFG